LSDLIYNNAYPLNTDKPEIDMEESIAIMFEGSDSVVINDQTLDEFEKRLLAKVRKDIHLTQVSSDLEGEDFLLQSLFRGNTNYFEHNENRVFLQSLVQVLLNEKDLSLEITAHKEKGASKLKDLRNAMTDAESLKDFFLSKNIDPIRIRTLSAGSGFPLAKTSSVEKLDSAAALYNNRIEFRLTGKDKQEKVKNRGARVDHHLREGKWLLYNSLQKGLSYKLEMFQLDELKNAPFVEGIKDCIVEKDQESGLYSVYSGIFKRYKDAEASRAFYREKRNLDSRILPTLNGITINRSEALEIADKYLDLVNYLEKMDSD